MTLIVIVSIALLAGVWFIVHLSRANAKLEAKFDENNKIEDAKKRAGNMSDDEFDRLLSGTFDRK